MAYFKSYVATRNSRARVFFSWNADGDLAGRGQVHSLSFGSGDRPYKQYLATRSEGVCNFWLLRKSFRNYFRTGMYQVIGGAIQTAKSLRSRVRTDEPSHKIKGIFMAFPTCSQENLTGILA